MRIGKNPAKDKKLSKSNYHHQVIVPVYIPNAEGYFEDSFKILKICLSSLFKTIHSNTFITVVNNGSSENVINYLNTLLSERLIHEVIHTSNIGKINAILKGVVGQNFKLVTITDADVLFLNGWQEATYELFKAFPKAGVVSPVPLFRKQLEYTQSFHFDYFFSKKVRFSPVKNPEAMTLFAKSIGWPRLDEKWKDLIMTVTKNNVTAVVGAPHFVATYKSELFDEVPSLFSTEYLGNRVVQKFFDTLVVKFNAYRLSTYDNYAYHLGNVKEDWMEEELKQLKQNTKNPSHINFKKLTRNNFGLNLKTKTINMLFSFRFVKNAYYKYKGLSKGKEL
ncbi:MAG: glycosyltransferase [Flavobacteriaceae bacterium]